MPKQIKTSWNSGEQSEYMAAREDINKYHNGASKMINATVLPHGGFVKRSGTEYIATAPNKANLLPFEFSVDDTLVLEFSNLLLRFYKDQSQVSLNAGTEDLSSLDNIVAHWLLNDIGGTTVIDDDGATHNGTASVNTSILTTSDAKAGSLAFDLDGQYDVTVGVAADEFSFTDDSNDSEFSIAAWGNVTQRGGIQTLVSKWRDDSALSEWRLSLSADRKLQLHLKDSQIDLSSDAVSQWKLNDNAANTIVVDTIGLQNGVAEDNTSTYNTTGKINDAFDFNTPGRGVFVADNAAYSFAGDVPFSLAAWVKWDGTSGDRYIVSKWDGDDVTKREWRLYLDAGKPTFYLSDNIGDHAFMGTDDAISTGAWHLIVATYDGNKADPDGGMTIYVDNVVVAQAGGNNSYAGMSNLATKVAIGAQNASGSISARFTGQVDNVIIFSIELTATDVDNLWNSGSGTESLSGTVATISAVSDDEITTGWHFFTSTYSAPADETTAADGIILYVDGEAVDSTKTNSVNYTAMQTGAEEIRIGSQRNSGDSANELFWEDIMDEVSVFSDVLTPTEVASLYSVTAYSITSPYTSAEAFEIHVTQSADVMYIAHEDHHPKKLSRLDTFDWTLVDVPFTGGPFLVENTTSSSLVGFARTGGTARSEFYFLAGTTGTLTASGTDNQPFNSNMVGALWFVKHTRDNDNKTTTFAKDTNVVPTLTTFASGAIFIKGDYTITLEPVATSKSARLWRKEGSAPWEEVRSFVGTTSFSATEDEDNVLYAMTRSDNTINGTLTAKEQLNYGIVKITGFTSATVVMVEVIDKVYANNTNDNAVTTFQWAEGAWSDYRGYPRTVVFFEDRLWWASSTNNPDTLWSSRSGLYEDMSFSDLGLDDEAITFPINDNEVSQIQWMQARQVMAVGAANKEYRFGNSDPDKAVTPSERKATPQTSEGSHTIQPKILKDSIFFFQSLGKKLGKMKFDAIEENFNVEDSTMLSYRLFDSTPVGMTVQRVPDSIIWTVREDGVSPTLTYEPNEEVLGWARQIFGNSADVETPTGIVESIVVIHGPSEDEVWASVQWTINSSTVRHVVKFKDRDFGDIEDAFYVDSGVTYDSSATSTMTGGTHLIGETVAVFADGAVFDDAVVDGSGEIVLQKNGNTTKASTVQWGLPYTMKVRTMRHSIPQEGTTIQSRIKRINRTNIRYIRSLNGMAGQEYAGVEYLQPIEATFSIEAQDTKPDNRLSQGGFSEDAYTTIVSSDPVPFTALSSIIDIEVEK